MRGKLMMGRCVGVGIVLVLLSAYGRAHDGGHESLAMRTWYRADGSHFHGSFVSASETELRILTARGKVASISLSQLNATSRDEAEKQQRSIHELNNLPKIKLVNLAGNEQSAAETAARPSIADAFKAFEKSVSLRWNRDYLFVESSGIPDHSMMVGIRAWQQQVPLPQAYRGENAWRIPLHPTPAKQPVSAKGRFLRGAIALAVNGVPIFNPLNNRGDDAFLFGELDEFGGHCGRADDYHYHIAPVHLEAVVGKGNAIAYSLDGYPIYGYQDAAAPDFAPLDEINGHKDAQGNYHYHATPKYPYVNGGFYGSVVERGGQVDPQPRAEPLRPALPPLQGAKITKFEQSGRVSVLTYEVKDRIGTVQYTESESGKFDFVFTDPNGKKRTESYQSKQKGAGPRRPANENANPRKQAEPKPASEPATKNSGASIKRTNDDDSRIVLTSSSVDAKGSLSVDCTCDGKKQSPAVAWKNLPSGTQSVAISLWHTAPDREKSYWLVYNIAADERGVEQNARKVGTLGLNDRNRAEYDPMCSKGPGVKTYHLTLYVFAKPIDVPAREMNRERLLKEFKTHGLAESTLDFQYER